MNQTMAVRALFATAMWALAGCGSMVVPLDGSDARGDAVVTDGGTVCRTSDGRTLHPGESFALDCNTCFCQASGDFACTGLACVDAGPPGCHSIADCPSGSMCIGPAGCGVAWHCEAVGGCTADESPFCSCNNTTVYGSSSCPPEPYLHTGACEGVDAGECNGAFLDPSGNCIGPVDQPLPAYCCGPVDAGVCDGAFLDPSGLCRGPADQVLPPECCGGVDAGIDDAGSGAVDCDWGHSFCDSLPGPCPSGQVRSVTGNCWGACVPYTDCAPIPCDPAAPGTRCPTGLTCWTSTRTCGPYVR